MNKLNKIKIILCSSMLFCFSVIKTCFANVIVTAPSNGTCLNVAPGAYTTLGTIQISENNKGDFSSPQTNATLILTIPANFQFNPGFGNVTYTAGANITAAAIAVTATTITVTISVNGTNRFDDLNITNIQVRGTAAGASGQILRLAARGTATIAGDAAGGGIDHGTLSSAGATTFTTTAAGNWSAGSTWVGGIAPTCSATNIIIAHAVTADISSTITNLTINSGGNLDATNAVTVTGTFTINGTGIYTHNNTSNASSTIFSGTENFSTTSSLIMNKWYSYSVPLGTYVTGNFGNVTLNAGSVWDQDGQFAPARIKGTLTISKGQVEMDEGTGMTTALTLQDVVVTGTGNLLMANGANRNLTLTTGNFTDNSGSAYVTALMLSTYGTLVWNCNGSFNVSHDFSAIQGTGAQVVTANIHITGNLNVTGGLFDFIYLVNGGLNLIVDGNTTVTLPSGGSHWFHLIESNSQNLTYITTNLTVNGANSNNYLQGSVGFVIVNILNDFTSSGTDVFKFTYQSSSPSISIINIGNDFNVTSGSVYLGNSSQNITCNIARDLNINGASANFTAQYYSTGASNTSITVNRNFNMLSGTFIQTKNTGDITLFVNGILNMDAGTFKGTDHMAAGNWGIATFNFNSVDYDGGIMNLFDGRITDGRTIQVNVTNDLDLNFTNAADRVMLIVGTSGNNALLDLNVNGNFIVSGNSTANFISSGSTGDETVDVIGNMNISGSNTFFVGNISGTGNPHNISTNITGNLNVSAGVLEFSSLAGTASVNVTGNVSITGGTTSIKWDAGIANMAINGTYTQTNGTLYFHEKNATNLNLVSMTVANNFTQTGGTINFDSYAGSGNLTNTLTLNGANYTIGGTGIMTHANHLTANTVFGSLVFNRNGTMTFNRSSNTHDVQQVKQTVSALTLLNVSGSVNNWEIASHQSSIAADHTTLTINGTANMGLKEIYARAQANYYAQLTLNSGSLLKTQHTGGLYSGTATASCINSMISGNNRMNYFLDPASTVEYNGTNNQIITGVPNGIATGTQHKYGRLNINFTGTPDVKYVYPETTNKVFIRTELLLTSGELNLDNDHNPSNSGGRTITLENGAALTRTSGYIRSEVEDGSGIVKWNITTNSSFIFPFGYNSTQYIPFTFAPTSGSSGDVSLGTYHSAFDNTPYPPTVTHVRDQYGNDNSANTVDRFWDLIVTGNPTVSLTFTATAAEVGSIANPCAQRWVPAFAGWESSQGIQSNPTSFSTLASGITGLGVWWTLSASSSPLPVELISFNATCNKNKVLIAWATASEENNNFFTVERSSNNREFNSIKTIPGAGNSTHTINYSTIDENPLPGLSYYRLKQTDYNGQYKYSNALAIKSCREISNLTISEVSQLNGQLQVSVTGGSNENVSVNLFDGTGKLINNQKIKLNNGQSEVYFKNFLSSGIYLINVAGNEQTVSRKIYKN